MKKPETIQGYLNTLKRLSDIEVNSFKDYDLLHDNLKEMLAAISANIESATWDLVFNSAVEDDYLKEHGEKPLNLKWGDEYPTLYEIEQKKEDYKNIGHPPYQISNH